MDKKVIDILLKNLVIIVDTREKVNGHVLNYLDKAGIPYVSKGLKFGDYSAFIKYNEATAPYIDDIFSFENYIVIERKASVNELVGNFKHRQRFFNEFERAKEKRCKIQLLVEECDGLNKIIYGDYRSEYNPKALYKSLKALEDTYDFQTKFLDKKISGLEIYYTIETRIKSLLKRGILNAK